MNNRTRMVCLLLAIALVAGCGGCRHKPAYSDIDANRSPRDQNENNGGQASGQSPDSSAPASPPPQPTAVKMPRFLNIATGGIRDLPTYKPAARLNVQIGPVQGVNVMTLLLRTGDPMDRVRPFYEQGIKDNHWTIVSKTLDLELCEWMLSKGDDSARVQIKKDIETGKLYISIVRAEPLEAK